MISLEENKQKGFIKLYRSMINWEWYDDANTMRVFLHCLFRANHESTKWHGQIIERGSFITSYNHFATELNLSVQNVRTSFKKLILTNELTIKTTRRNSIITINNYNSYQENNTHINTQTNNQITNHQQSDNKPLTTNNELKETKELKNKRTINAKNLFLKFFEVDESFKEYESFKELFLKWLEYKTAIKKQYKSEQGLKGAFLDLIRLSNKNVKMAENLINYAISKEWQGIYSIPKSAKITIQNEQKTEQNEQHTNWERYSK